MGYFSQWEAEERVAALAGGWGVCPALLCEAGGCSRTALPPAKAAEPGTPVARGGGGMWAARAWLCFPRRGTSEHVTKSQLFLSPVASPVSCPLSLFVREASPALLLSGAMGRAAAYRWKNKTPAG